MIEEETMMMNINSYGPLPPKNILIDTFSKWEAFPNLRICFLYFPLPGITRS